MSHNLHFIVTKAESPKDACRDVENYIEDWGNDNNWRTIMGCISEDDELFQYDESHKYDWDNTGTIAKINELMKGYIEFDPTDGLNMVSELIDDYKNGNKPSGLKWLLCREFINILYHKAPYMKEGGVEFNVLENEIWEYQYDEQGVTHTGLNHDQNMKKYVVFVDMHS